MSRDLLTWIWLAFPMGLCFGYIIGGRHSDAYWADHDDGGAVHHRGSFYRVTKLPALAQQEKAGADG